MKKCSTAGWDREAKRPLVVILSNGYSMNKPYIRELEEVDGFKVWEVDGKYIRDNTDREFTNFGQHFRFHLFQKHEFWIDHEAHPERQSFY